jgi:5-(carboxyamino)imidazole ribonucleotide synthase
MLRPGQTIGILGGGQLARMLAMAAAPFGLHCHIIAPKGDNPAFEVAKAHSEAAYDDFDALARFAEAVDVITYEFENVPAATAAFLSARKPVRPGPEALAVTQDRLSEKQFLQKAGLPLAGFAAIDNLDDLKQALVQLGLPAVLKTRRMGYDGKGQVMIRTFADAEAGLERLGGGDCVLEAFVPFIREVSVIAARALDGTVRAFDVCENRHRHHILSQTVLPAALQPATATKALAYAEKIAENLAYVGVFTVELFVVGEKADEHVLVNEIAPRVHNSGHWTIEGAQTSQFAQHIRAIAGWPLGGTHRLGRIVMDNLVGEEAADWAQKLVQDGAHLHLYGKAEIRQGRKMGHVTHIFPEKTD